jgi:hypothetical protein
VGNGILLAETAGRHAVWGCGPRDASTHAVSIRPSGYSTCVRAWFAAWWWGERFLDGRCFDTPSGLLNVRAAVVCGLVVGARDFSTHAVSIRPAGYSTCVRRYAAPRLLRTSSYSGLLNMRAGGRGSHVVPRCRAAHEEGEGNEADQPHNEDHQYVD